MHKLKLPSLGERPAPETLSDVLFPCPQEENAKLKETVQTLNKHSRIRGGASKIDARVFDDLAKFQEENEELKRGIIEYSEKWRAKST